MLPTPGFLVTAFSLGFVFVLDFLIAIGTFTFLAGSIVSTRRVWSQNPLSAGPVILIIKTVCGGGVNGGTTLFVGKRRGGNSVGGFKVWRVTCLLSVVERIWMAFEMIVLA